MDEPDDDMMEVVGSVTFPAIPGICDELTVSIVKMNLEIMPLGRVFNPWWESKEDRAKRLFRSDP